jgi:hypothetical protein
MDEVWKNFFAKMPIKPAPMLTELRSMVLARSEKRSPKWKFRLSPDLVLQIQPKLTTALLKFECVAVQCERADLGMLMASGREIRQLGRPFCILKFDLRADTPDQWIYQARSGTQGRCDKTTYATVRDRIIAAFQEGRFDRLNPEILLGSHCLCCGKGLTDPVSQARHIGPECAGTSSEQLPFVLQVTDTPQAA